MLVNGTRLVPDASGALWWPNERTLIVADLHLEKGSSYAVRRRGFLPPYDTRATLAELEKVIRRHSPSRVICLGDSFHDRGAAERLHDDDRRKLAQLMTGTDWVWLLGNHDPEPPKDVGGTAVEELVIGGLKLRHAPLPGRQPGEVSGHLHPKAAVTIRGRRLTSRCFATDGARLVLPSFGAYTGGLDVLDAAFTALFHAGFHAWMLGERQVFPIASLKLAAIA